MKHTAFKGKHKIQDHWEDTIYEVVEQHLKTCQFSKSNHGGDDRVKMVHRNLLLPLSSKPLGCAGEPDNSRSLANPKETMGTQVAIVVSAIASHVQNLSAYEGVQVTNMIQKGLKFVTTLLWKCLNPPGLSIMSLYNYPYR